ncbi:MAG: TetR/AcrR family transcriptional regulator [Mycobacterium sp.]|nr:TetR/AcrR family transcriptional regulator [Mycobacterium sp.]
MVRASENGTDSSAFARREQIIDAARAVIEEYGPDALTGQIAQRAGLARPNVYRHFASKDELDQAVAGNAYQELRAEIRSRLDLSGTPADVIRAPIAVQVTWADRHPNLYRFLLSRGYQRSSRRRQAERREFAADLAVVGEHYFPHFADDPDAAAALVAALGGLIDASVLGWLSRRTETRERLIDRLTTQVWLLIDNHLRDVGVQIDPAVPLPQLGQTGS